jgi:hypothetical protein
MLVKVNLLPIYGSTTTKYRIKIIIEIDDIFTHKKFESSFFTNNIFQWILK